MSFKAEIVSRFGWNFDDGALDNDLLKYEKGFADGDEAAQANSIWHLEDVELANEGVTQYDLQALTRQVLGETITQLFYLVKAILVVVTSTAGGTLIIGDEGSNEFFDPWGASTGVVLCPPDSAVLLSNFRDGWTVDATHKQLQVVADNGDLTYSIAIIGTITLGGSGS